MMLIDVLQKLFPHASPVWDYNVTDRLDGTGQHLTFWDETKLGKQPTAEELAALMQD